MSAKPLFITFEGGEASGKSTQARVLERRLERLGYGALLIKEPGSTPLGERLRRLLKFSAVDITPEAELLLFVTARAQLVRTVIKPALARGTIVVCDRFADSTTAYQGYGRGLDMGIVRQLNAFATGRLTPDLTVLLDMPVEMALARRKPTPGERFERTAQAFHCRVREGYLALAGEEPARWLVLDGTLPPRDVARLVWRRVEGLLPPKPPTRS